MVQGWTYSITLDIGGADEASKAKMMAQLIVYANGLILTGYEINGFKTLAGLTTEFLQRAILTLDGHLSTRPCCGNECVRKLVSTTC